MKRQDLFLVITLAMIIGLGFSAVKLQNVSAQTSSSSSNSSGGHHDNGHHGGM